MSSIMACRSASLHVAQSPLGGMDLKPFLVMATSESMPAIKRSPQSLKLPGFGRAVLSGPMAGVTVGLIQLLAARGRSLIGCKCDAERGAG